jgi:hypothetical protein
MGKYGLTLHPDKTRLVPFQRPPQTQQNGKGPGSFDFLGFTLYWRRTLKGRWELACKTRRARLTRAIKAVNDLCRRQRHEPIEEQHAALSSRLKGHFNYFGVNGNYQSLSEFAYHTKRAWLKWLCRRSQRARLNWQRFQDLFKVFPLPCPKVVVTIWGT